jgi:hypothetical protein
MASLHAGGDRPGAFQGFGVCGVNLQVVDDTLVNQFGLGRGHPDDTVTSRDFAARGDGAVTPDADPQHLDFPELEPPLRTMT